VYSVDDVPLDGTAALLASLLGAEKSALNENLDKCAYYAAF
jgi:hypothetical protein